MRRKFGVAAHVDAGEIPEDSLSPSGVLELQDIGLALRGGQLDRDTATIRVVLPGRGEGAAATLKGLHFPGNIRDLPSVDSAVQFVDDLETAAVAALTTLQCASVASRQSQSESSEGREKAKSLGEQHFDRSR